MFYRQFAGKREKEEEMERKFLSKIYNENTNENTNSVLFEQNSWVNFTILDIGAGYKVKRFEVLPLKQLSFQTNFDAQHWTIVQGTAKVTINDRTFSVRAGETISVGVGDIHRVENPDNSETLVFINVQCGVYFGESELVCFSEDFEKIASAA
jgi:mannose-6-phosphate isomerase